jgi:lipopolysaccharide heptosyltransferase I
VNILIIKLSSLGDIVQALPVLKVLREKYPGARIDWLVNEGMADILVENPFLHTVHRWDRESWRKPRRFLTACRNAARVVRNLRRARYDLVVDLQGLFRSGLLAFLSGARRTVGFANAREMASMFYGEKLRLPTEGMHSVERYVFAVAGDVCGEKEFSIGLSGDARREAAFLLDRMGYDSESPLVVLVPGGRWQTKRWPPEHFAALAEALAEREGVQVGFVGSPRDTILIQRIEALSRCRTMDFSAKTTLRQLACLLKEAELVVGNDSGPMHMAAAVGTPVVGLYGPTSPERTGPYGKKHTVLTSDLPCSPCFRRDCKLSAACMESISVDSVLEACKRYLDEAKKERGIV